MQRGVTRLGGLAAAVIGLGVSAVGCSQLDMVKAQMHFKDGTSAYRQQDYRKAATEYAEAVKLNPDLAPAYFYLANSYDNLYRPSRAGEPENDSLLQQAKVNYELAAQHEGDAAQTEEDSDLKQQYLDRQKLALQYLVALYGPDKLNDPAQAEPIIQQLIELDPEDSANYFALTKLYEDTGRYEEAEEVLARARQARPNDPDVYMQIAGYYNRQGEFDRTIEALQQRTQLEPDNPEAHYTVATFYWDKAYRDFRITDEEKLDYVMKGIEATDKAIDLNADYMEALVYKNLLLRLQANLETDRGRQQALLREADELRDRAEELRKQKAAGVS